MNGFETEVDRVKRDRYEKQEAKRAPKIQADQVITLNAWLTGVLVAFVSSAVVSFNGITSVAAFVGLSAGWMSAPIAIISASKMASRVIFAKALVV